MPTANHSDQDLSRCAASEPASSCFCGMVCREQEQLHSDQLTLPGNQASSGYISISSHPNIWLFPYALLPTSICYFVSGKSSGPFQSCVSAVPSTSGAKECNSSILRLHQESWIIIPRIRVSLLQLQDSEAFCPISSLYLLGHKL